MAGALERHAEAGSPERQLGAEISVLADELTGLAGEDIERRGGPLVEAVTALWAYRYDFPAAARPFPMFEPALYAVQYLDREASYLRHRSSDAEAASRAPESRPDNPSTFIAGQIDAALALLVEASLLKAVRLAVDTAAEWIALARAAGFNGCFELAAIDRFGSFQNPDFSGFEKATQYEVARSTDKLQAMIELAAFLKSAPLP
jgi:hypothetical protein